MSQKLAKLNRRRFDAAMRRTAQGEARIVQEIGLWEKDIQAAVMRRAPERELLGVLGGLPDRLAEILGADLERMLEFGYSSAADNLIRSLPQSSLTTAIVRRLRIPQVEEGAPLWQPPLPKFVRNRLPVSWWQPRLWQPRHLMREDGADEAFGLPIWIVNLLKRKKRIPPREFIALAHSVLFPPVKKRRARAMLKKSIWGDTLSWNDRLKKMGRNLGFSSLVSDLVKSPHDVTIDTLTKIIAPAVDGAKWQARRIARTESLRVANQAQRETWKPLSRAGVISAVQIVATIDSATRDHHVARHGRIYSQRTPDGPFISDGGELLPALPDEPNCRCWDSPILPGADAFNVGGEREREEKRRTDARIEKISGAA